MTAQTIVTETPATHVVETPQRDEVVSAHTYRQKKAIFRTYQVIWYMLGVVEVLLLFRIFLKAIGANPLSGFANFVYTVSDPFALPFAGVLGTSASNGAVLEWSTFIAMAVYALIVYGIEQLLQIVKPTNPDEVIQNVDTV